MFSVIVVVVLRELIARPLLNLADLLLVLIGVPADFARRRLRPEQLTTKPTVAIVGGGFSGLWAQRALSDDYDVTLVDFKDYFEYTPGILRCFVEPKALRSLTAALPRRRNKLLRCEVLDVSPSCDSCRKTRTTAADWGRMCVAPRTRVGAMTRTQSK